MTDTNIWKTQRWFKKLSIEFKCAFFYIKDQCDHAGMWQIDVLSLCEDLGVDTFDFKNFIAKCNQDFDKMTGEPIVKERLIILKDSSLWLTGFMQFQYQDKGFLINAAIPAVKSALDILRGHGVYQKALDKGYFTLKEGLPNPTERTKDKDKDKDIDKDKDKEKGGVGEKTKTTKIKGVALSDLYPFYSPSFETVWKDFLEMRNKKRKPLTERAVILNLNSIQKLSAGNEKLAIAICEQTIMRSWDGFFELKETDQSKPEAKKTTGFVFGQKHNAH